MVVVVVDLQATGEIDRLGLFVVRRLIVSRWRPRPCACTRFVSVHSNEDVAVLEGLLWLFLLDIYKRRIKRSALKLLSREMVGVSSHTGKCRTSMCMYEIQERVPPIRSAFAALCKSCKNDARDISCLHKLSDASSCVCSILLVAYMIRDSYDHWGHYVKANDPGPSLQDVAVLEVLLWLLLLVIYKQRIKLIALAFSWFSG
ncbi:hypothetical protein F511_42427 [Dorcoceras hygrometricum]|uniref:Uncharacterized protein n=1 Tax=Dorcoceras hygrometricum TaxID=472368 RepID=A0A2Z7CHS0_9LAMI|nr:hypothetical protein F511_42427 [Dorcoceras hygrometricum]